MKKYDDTRIVTFEADYAPGGKPIYKKGETHAIHHETVEKLKNVGAKMVVKTLEPKKIVDEKKKALEKAA